MGINMTGHVFNLDEEVKIAKKVGLGELEGMIQSMINDNTVEAAWDLYRARSIAFQELSGKAYVPQ